MHLFIYSSFVLTSFCGGWLPCYLSCRGGSNQGAAILTIEGGSGGKGAGSLLHSIGGVDSEDMANL